MRKLLISIGAFQFTNKQQYTCAKQSFLNVLVCHTQYIHRPDASQRQQRRLPPCPLVIALVPLKCYSRNLQFPRRVPFHIYISRRKCLSCAFACSKIKHTGLHTVMKFWPLKSCFKLLQLTITLQPTNVYNTSHTSELIKKLESSRTSYMYVSLLKTSNDYINDSILEIMDLSVFQPPLLPKWNVRCYEWLWAPWLILYCTDLWIYNELRDENNWSTSLHSMYCSQGPWCSFVFVKKWKVQKPLWIPVELVINW